MHNLTEDIYWPMSFGKNAGVGGSWEVAAKDRVNLPMFTTFTVLTG